MGVYTNTPPTFLAGELPDADKFTEINLFMTATLAAWSTWTPTLVNITVGSGSHVARYRQLGKTVDWWWRFVFGAGSSVGTGCQFTLPAAPASSLSSGDSVFPHAGQLHDASPGARRQGSLQFISGSTVQIGFWNATPDEALVTATAPWTWATSDAMTFWGTYEAA